MLKARLDSLRSGFKKIFADKGASGDAKKRKMNFGYVDLGGQQAHSENLSIAHDKAFDRMRYLMSLINLADTGCLILEAEGVTRKWRDTI